MSDAAREQENAQVIEGEYRFEGNHDPMTEWAHSIEEASTESGTSVVQQEWNDEDHQKWMIEPVDEEGKYHRVVSVHDENLVWRLDGDATEDMAQYNGSGILTVDEWDESDEQLFRFVPLDSTHPYVNEGDERWQFINKATKLETTVSRTTGAIPSVQGGQASEGQIIDSWWYAGDAEQQHLLHEL